MKKTATKTESMKKKEYLMSYQESIQRIRAIESELSEIRDMKTDISGKGSRKADDLDRLEQALLAEQENRITIYEEIINTIERLEDRRERDVLLYRYIKGMDWQEIANVMHFSERHVTRLHGWALANMGLPEK